MPRPPDDCLDAVLTERHPFLRALIEQPRSKCDLEDEIDGSRSTLDRALRDLADAELATYEDGVWKPTPLGRCSYRTRNAYLERLENLAEVAPLFNELSSGSPVDCAFVIGADVHETDPSMPDAIMQTLLDSVEGGQVVSVVTPVVVTGFAEDFYERVSRGKNYSLELLIPPDVFERTRAAFPTLTDELLDDENVSLHTASIPFSFGLWIVDSAEAGIIIFTDQGVRGILVNDTTEALDWATEQYERVKQDADPVFLRGHV
ncbi:winged helix-turn-helix domain-containing protein [Halorubrum trapanicum]|uniref:helix-turn-helix transcriptional regulator n=1 Tax=Halorubrum trapanicum TaxID=29284 RepID=UPI000BBA8EFC|nr:helix-turn-helix domain-containing protein [Halorubrum trapanicum]